MHRIINSQLAAHYLARQVELILLADAIGQRTDRIVRQWWRQLWPKIKDNSFHLYPVLIRETRRLPELLQAGMGEGLEKLVRWTHKHATKVLGKSIPLAWLQAVALTLRRRHLGEDIESPQQPGVIEILRDALGRIVQARDILAPLRDFTLTDAEARAYFVRLLFPGPSESTVQRILSTAVQGQTWYQALDASMRAAQFGPDRLVQTIAASYAQGKGIPEIAREILPFVDGVRSRARSLARTYAVAIAGATQMEAQKPLDDLIIGWRVFATLDENTRPPHRFRNGTIYHKNPAPGQKGLRQMPHPPMEAEDPDERPPGAPQLAKHCRCGLSPVLSPNEYLLNDPAKMALFRERAGETGPNPATFSDWFDAADEKRRRLAMGTRRYSYLKDEVGERLEYGHFVEPKTGDLMTMNQLRSEGSAEREARLNQVRQIIQQRRADIESLRIYGFLNK